MEKKRIQRSVSQVLENWRHKKGAANMQKASTTTIYADEAEERG